MKSTIFCIFFTLLFLNFVSAHYKFLVPRPRSDATSSYGAPCGVNYTEVNQTTISNFPIKGNVTNDMLHATSGTLIYYYSNDGGKNFIQLTGPTKYNITEKTGENITTPVDLSKAGATVGSQGILQSVYYEGNDTSPTNTTLYECADIKITAENTTTTQAKTGAGSINTPYTGFTLFSSLFTLFISLFLFSYLSL